MKSIFHGLLRLLEVLIEHSCICFLIHTKRKNLRTEKSELSLKFIKILQHTKQQSSLLFLTSRRLLIKHMHSTKTYKKSSKLFTMTGVILEKDTDTKTKSVHQNVLQSIIRLLKMALLLFEIEIQWNR